VYGKSLAELAEKLLGYSLLSRPCVPFCTLQTLDLKRTPPRSLVHLSRPTGSQVECTFKKEVSKELFTVTLVSASRRVSAACMVSQDFHHSPCIAHFVLYFLSNQQLCRFAASIRATDRSRGANFARPIEAASTDCETKGRGKRDVKTGGTRIFMNDGHVPSSAVGIS
jgi:hypothetical protein